MQKLVITLLVLLVLGSLINGFIVCPSSGVQQCSGQSPYQIVNVDNVVISNCVFLGCPQIIISASNVTIRNCTFNSNGIVNTVLYDKGAALYITSDVYRVRPTRISISDSTFMNYRSAVSSGGAIYIGNALSEPAVIVNTLFYNNVVSFEGGAMEVISCPLIVRNCTFNTNQATNGGAFITRSSTTLVEGCTFLNNVAAYGGAIYKETSDSLIINNCVCTGNTGNGHGGFLFISSSTGNIVFSNSIVQGGTAGGVGATAYFESVSSAQIENCTFSNMRASSPGGTIYFWVAGTVSFKNVNITTSQSSGSDGGGALLFYLNGNVTVDNCIFTSCIGDNGGALSFINNLSPTVAIVRNSQFIRNVANDKGGAIFSDGNNMNIYNCVFNTNSAGTGGSIHANGPQIYVNVRSSTFSASHATLKGGTFSINGLVSLNTQSIVISNSGAGDSAGAMILLGPLYSPAIFTDLTITGSTATNLGGALYFDADASFVCTNCQILNTMAGQGGFIYAEGPNKRPSTMINSRVQNSLTINAGGFISLRTSYMLNVLNCTFIRGTAAAGAAFNIALNSALTISNSTVINATCTNTGGLVYSSGNSAFSFTDSIANGIISYIDATIAFSSTGTLNFARSSLSNLQLLGTGSYFTLEMSTLNLDILSVTNGPSLLYLKLQSTVNIGRLTSVNCIGGNFDGSLISCYQGSSVVLGSGSSVSGYQGNVIIALFSKSKIKLSGATFRQNLPTSYGFRVSEGSTLNFQSSQLVGGMVATSYSPIYLDAGSTVNCADSQVTGNYFGGCGTVYVGKASFFNASNCAIMGNSFYSQGFTCNSVSQVLNGYGGGICCDGQAILSNGAVVSNNSAINGGAMYVGPLASVQVKAGVSISNNRASASGGAFYFGGAQMQIDTKGVTVTGNIAGNSAGNSASSSSSLAYFGGLSDGVIRLSSLTTSSLPASVISGGVLVEHPDTALKTLSQGLVSALPSTVTWTGRASYLRVLNRNDFINAAKSLNLSQSLPSIVVATYDYFGNAASFDPSSIVSVQLSEVSQSSQLSGDVIKSILDASTGTLSFDNVQLPQRLPGSYVISVSAVPGTIKALPISDNSSNLLPVTFTPCGSGQRLVASLHDCFPMIYLSGSFRVVMSVIAILGLLYSLYCLVAILRLKEHRQMKKIVRNFNLLTIQITGISISLLSLIFQISPMSIGCGISLWLENIGFTLILFALTLATLEILVGIKKGKNENALVQKKSGDVVQAETSPAASTNFSPAIIRTSGFLCLAALVIYLGVWTAIDPLQYQDVFFAASKVVLVDKCSSRSTIFFLLLQAVKLSVAIVAAYLTLRIERKKSSKTKKSQLLSKKGHVDSDGKHNDDATAAALSSDAIQLDESELLSLCSYNWVVFGPVISLIAQTSISDPDTGFFFDKLSVLVPSLLTLFIMGTSRIYICSFFKGQA